MAIAAPLALAASAIGGIVSAFGAVQSGMAAESQAKYQAAVAQNNAIIAGQNADFAAKAGAEQAQQKDFETAQTLGKEVAGQAASGVDVNTGSPLEVRKSTSALGRYNTLSIVSDAQQQVYSELTKQTSYTAEASADQAAGANAMTAGYLGGAGSLLSGAASFGDKWATYQQKGVKLF